MGGNDRAWTSLDEGTDRLYKSTSRPTFNLSFKLFPNEQVGSQPLTTYKTWVKALSLYAMPSVDAKVNVNAMANNAMDGFYGAGGLLATTFKSVAETFSGDSSHGKTNENSTQENTDENSKEVVEQTTDSGLISNVGDAVMNVVNTASDVIASRDGEGRVYGSSNKKNFYGAKLWYLKVIPGLFKNPLVVYISNWDVAYSKEINPDTSEPIWVEFKLTCEMDQVASAPVWMKYLGVKI